MSTRLGRDYYVGDRLDAYSVHPEAIGRMITVTADLDRVSAHCGDRLVADHQRLWGAHGLATDPTMLRLRRCCGSSICIDEHHRAAHLEVDVEVADLSAYDGAFGTGEVA